MRYVVEESNIDAVHRVMAEIREAKDEARVLKEGLKDMLEQMEDYATLQEEVKALAAKRAEFKKSLQSDNEYQKLHTQLEETKFKMKDLQEILSHHLVAYYSESGKTQITDPEGDARPLLISVKLGKPEANIQPQS